MCSKSFRLLVIQIFIFSNKVVSVKDHKSDSSYTKSTLYNNTTALNKILIPTDVGSDLKLQTLSEPFGDLVAEHISEW